MLPILVPLAAALLFPFAAMALKRAMDLSRNPLGTVLISNIAIAVVFLPLFAWEGKPPPDGGLHQPAVAGLLFFLAQVAAFKSFAAGDLSIAIPAQGTKVLLVAALTVLFLGEDVDRKLWAAAGLTVGAIYFLQDRQAGGGKRARERVRKSVIATLAYALIASLAFAAFDVLVQKWTPGWGMSRFGPWAFLCQALLSAALLFLPGRKMADFLNQEGRAWAWLGLGAFLMALITLGLVVTIGIYGKATVVNVLFNSRCISSVLFVWLAGRWFANKEAKSGRKAMAHRLLGAGFMMAAVILALL